MRSQSISTTPYILTLPWRLYQDVLKNQAKVVSSESLENGPRSTCVQMECLSPNSGSSLRKSKEVETIRVSMGLISSAENQIGEVQESKYSEVPLENGLDGQKREKVISLPRLESR